MIRFKINVIEALTNRGFPVSVIRQRKLLSQNTLGALRHGGNITLESLNIVCLLLRCQPGDIIEMVATDEEKIAYF